MTIKLIGRPGEYHHIGAWQRAYLRIEYDLPNPVITQLDDWARAGDTDEESSWIFATWLDAADAARRTLALRWPESDPLDQMALCSLVTQATHIVHDMVVLTQSGRVDEINHGQQAIVEHAAMLLDAARMVPAAYRRMVTEADLPGSLPGAGAPPHASAPPHAWSRPRASRTRARLGQALRPWQVPSVLRLVRQPMLVRVLPQVVLVHERTRLGANLASRLRAGRRLISTGDLRAEIGPDRLAVLAAFRARTRPHPNGHLLGAGAQIFGTARELLIGRCQEMDIGPHEVAGSLAVQIRTRMTVPCFLAGLALLTEFPQLQVIIRRHPVRNLAPLGSARTPSP